MLTTTCRHRSPLAVAFLAVAILATTGAAALAEPLFQSASASQTVGSISFPSGTLEVTLISDGPHTCYYRLFTDANTAGNATTSSAPLKANEPHAYELRLGQGTEGYDGNVRARYYKSLSYICATGQTATVRVYYK